MRAKLTHSASSGCMHMGLLLMLTEGIGLPPSPTSSSVDSPGTGRVPGQLCQQDTAEQISCGALHDSKETSSSASGSVAARDKCAASTKHQYISCLRI